jgi:hypothetical protein
MPDILGGLAGARAGHVLPVTAEQEPGGPPAGLIHHAVNVPPRLERRPSDPFTAMVIQGVVMLETGRRRVQP